MNQVTLAAIYTGILAAVGSPLVMLGCVCSTGGWEVSTIRAVDASTDAECAVCGPDAGPESCYPTTTDAGPAVVCMYGEESPECGGAGRRPAGLRVPPSPRARTVVGAYLSRMAYLEAVSVDAFAILARELAEHHAPRALIHRAEIAGRDEVRHAQITGALARRFGGVPRPPRRRHPPRAGAAPRPLEQIARENMVEGCVRETWGALVARFQAEAAGDAAVRAAMRRIAADETRHAALSWQVACWAALQLDAPAQRRLAGARDRAAARVVESAARPIPPALARIVGLPAGLQAAQLAEGLRRALWI